MNDYTYEDIKVGMNISFEKEITTDMEDMFRAITGDENPLHKDDDFAKSNSDGRFPRHVTFGMLTASLCSTVAGMYLPGKNSLIHSFDEISFKKPVFTGDVLTVEAKVTDKNDELKLIFIKVIIRNCYGEIVSRARMKVLVMK